MCIEKIEKLQLAELVVVSFNACFKEETRQPLIDKTLASWKGCVFHLCVEANEGGCVDS